MSNSSILDRVESKIQELASGKMRGIRFSDYFRASINAMEAIPYEVIKEAGDLGYEAEVAGFAEEEDCFGDMPSVVARLKIFIQKVREIYP